MPGPEQTHEQLPPPPLLGSDEERAKLRERRCELVKDATAEQLRQYREECEKFARETVRALRTNLELPESAEPHLLRAITIGPPAAPPVESDEWKRRHAGIMEEWKEVGAVLAQSFSGGGQEKSDARTQWLAYQEHVEAYESDAEKQGKREFLVAVGFPEDMHDDEFEEFLRDILAPLPDPSKAVDPKYRGKAAEWHATLEAERAELAAKLPLIFRHERDADARRIASDRIALFLIRRELYERKFFLKSTEISKWSIYAGVFANEAWEEGLEDTIMLNRIEFIRNLDARLRRKVLEGWRGCSSALAARGVPMESMGKVLRYMDELPMGPKFWRRMFSIQSPVTVFLLGYYLYQSENKMKAATTFMSFVGMSNAMEFGGEKLAAVFDASLAKLIQRLEKAQSAIHDVRKLEKIRRRLSVLKKMQNLGKIPVPAPIKFAIILTAAIGVSKQIDAATTWIDEQIAEGTFKRRVSTVLQTLEVPFVWITEIAENLGGYGAVNPEVDAMRVLGADTAVGYHHTIEDWNKRTDVAMLEEKNPVLRELWKLRKIDDPMRWADQQSVVLFSQVSSLKQQEDALERQLADRGMKIELNACGIATEGNGVDDADKRNDEKLKMAFGWATVTPAIRDRIVPTLVGIEKAKAYVLSLPKDDELRKAFTEYEKLAHAVAKEVSVYRHLGLYNRTQWLGDLEKLSDGIAFPTQVQRGLVEQIVFETQRRKRTRPEYYDLPPEKYAEYLISAVQLEDALPLSIVDKFFLETSERAGEMWRELRAWLQHPDQPFPIDTQEDREHGAKRRALFELMVAAHDAGKIVPAKELSRILGDIREAILQGRAVTLEELQKKREELNQAVLDSSLAHEGIYPQGQEFRRRLGIPDGTPVFSKGMLIGEVSISDGRTFDPFQSAFRQSVELSPQRGGAYKDLLLFQGDMGAAETFRLISFACPTDDQNGWSVRIGTVQMTTAFRPFYGERVDHMTTWSPTVDCGFEEWQKQYSGLAAKLAPQFQAIQEKRRAEEAAYQRKQRQEETQRMSDGEKALEQSAAFMPVGGEYWVKYGQHAAVYTPKKRMPAFSAQPRLGTSRFQPDEYDAFEFELRADPKKSVQPWIVRNLDFHTQKDLTDAQRKILIDVITTPIEGDADQTLERIVNLKANDVYLPGGLARLFGYTAQNYSLELLKGLKPRYEKAGDKRKFLTSLLEELREHEAITEDTVPAIITGVEKRLRE